MSTTLITGSSSGIGFELAKICAKNGHNLVLVSRNKADLSSTVFKDVKVLNLSLDLSKPGAAQKLHSITQKEKVKIDILINNAGFGDFNLFLDADSTKLNSMINLNVVALTELTHTYAKDMKKQGGGKIMNLASTAAFLPGPYMATYYATKHFVLSLSEALAEEFIQKNVPITVTALCPGPTASKFQESSNMKVSKLVKGKSLPTAQDVAEFGYKEMLKGTRVATHKMDSKFKTFMPRVLPRKVVTKIVFKASQPK
jgi:short-subunit dehydrogenase